MNRIERAMARTVTLLLCALIGACGGMAAGPGPSTEPMPAAAQEQPLPRADWSTLGLSDAAWRDLTQEVQQRQLKIDQIGLLVDGRRIAAMRGPGLDERTLHDLRSASKSVTSLMIGAALQRGLLMGIDEPIGRRFPEAWARDRPAARLTLRQLLSMRTGLACDDWDAQSPGYEERMYGSADWVRFFFELPEAAVPDSRFAYCTAGLVAAGEVLARTAGRSVPVLARELLFEPLGIAGERWAAGAPAGVTDTGGHLRLSLEAMLKLGELVRRGGRWGERQLLAPDWIQQSLRSHGAVDPTGRFSAAHMGLAWWLEPLDAEGRARSAQARGSGGQFIIVLPEVGAVVAATGTAFNADAATQLAVLDLVRRHLIPVLQGRQP